MEADTGNILIDELARKKAQLLSYGLIEVPKDILSNLSVERPKSGPSSGSNLVGFEFKGRRLKLVVSRKRERFRLQRIGNEYVILDGDEIFLKVEPLDLSTHAPGQVFISLDNRCIFNCLFCRRESIVIGEEKLLGFVRRHLEKGISSLSITSGVFPSVEGHVERIERFVKGIRKDYDDISIGVEVVVGSREDIERLRSAGVDEMKINLQFPTKKLFDAICGYMEYEKILRSLEDAVAGFGKGKVTSNIIFGVGERDEDIICSLERLADMGVIPNLRMIRLDKGIKRAMERRLGYSLEKQSPERILKLALHQKRILEKRGLTTREAKTMCLACGCCDLVPFWDI